MVKFLLSILLALGIVACPLLCGRGAVCCRAEHTHDAQACCAACRQAESTRGDDRDSMPQDHDSRSGKCSGCICGGALVEDASSQDFVVNDLNWIAIPPVAPLRCEPSDLHTMFNPRGPLPDDDMNPGRAMRCLMMSYLC
jgi:hypothetical protein